VIFNDYTVTLLGGAFSV